MDNQNQEVEYSSEEGVVYKVTKEPVNTDNRLCDIREAKATAENTIRQLQAQIILLQEEEDKITNLVSE